VFPAQLGKALAPREVIFVGDTPKTRNARVMRRIVRAAYLGENLGDTLRLGKPSVAGGNQIDRAWKVAVHKRFDLGGLSVAEKNGAWWNF